DSVVEAVPALLEERMDGQLAREQRTGFLELRLDQRVPGLPDGRLAAVALDPRRKQPRALHVVDDLGPRIAAEHVLRQQHQLAVGIDDLAVLGDKAEPVAVAVEGQAELALSSFQFPY